MTQFAPIDAGLLNRFMDDYAVEVLREYFNSGKFTGGQFERFAGGGDNAETAGRFTTDDLVAVSFVGSRIPGRAAIEILLNRSEEFDALLAQIPVDVDLWDAPDEIVGPESAAHQLFTRLAELPGMSAMSAAKLLARKRPRLIPIYDRLHKATLERKQDDDWLLAMRAVFTAKPNFVKQLRELRDTSGVGSDISVLRVLYAAVWVRQFGRPEPIPEAES
jgi:hypothetical protein